jgi:hypothetical protein
MMTTTSNTPHGFYSEWKLDPFFEIRTIPAKWDLSSMPENSLPDEEIHHEKVAPVTPGLGIEREISFSTWQFDSYFDEDPWLEWFYWSAF